MSDSVYKELLAAGAPDLPVGYYYSIRQWENHWDSVPNVRISIWERVIKPPRIRHWFWRHLPSPEGWMEDPTATFIAEETFSLVQESQYVAKDNVIRYSDEVVPALARSAAKMWAGVQTRVEQKIKTQKVAEKARELVGDHP